MAKVIGRTLCDVTLGSLTLTTNELITYSVLCLVALALLGVVIALCVKRGKKKKLQTDKTEENVVTTPVNVVAPIDNNSVEIATQAYNDNTPATRPVTTVIVPAGQPVPESTDGDNDVVVRGKVQIIYNKSLTAKLCQAEDELKAYYDELKSELLSYKGVKNRISWKHETFRKGRTLLAKLRVRGKTLCIYLPLNASDYEESKYKVVDVGDVKTNAETPCLYQIKNDRRCRYAKELIATAMGNNDLVQQEVVVEKHSDEFPYDTTDNLIRRKLIKVWYSKTGDGTAIRYISAEEVNVLMTDEEAQMSVTEGTRIADRTKSGIVNVDVLSLNFEAGERVTLEEIKKRVPNFDKKVTFVKVLARGVIDKPLTVEADDFSLDAVKMILLTGGTVIRTLKK